ncbi:MAG: DMT family transporter [Trueperaceae bacterium]
MTRYRLYFWLLALLFGSSFPAVRFAVSELNPFELSFYRAVIAALGLYTLMRLRGLVLPKTLNTGRNIVGIGTLVTALPLFLLAWGLQRVPSGLGSVVMATSPLFALLMASLVFKSERMTLVKVAGLVLSLVGVVILTGGGAGGSLLGQLAIVLAALSYATGTTFSRQVMGQEVHPLVVATGAMITTAVLLGVATFGLHLLGGPTFTALSAISPQVLWVTLALGTIFTVGPHLLIYPTIQALGASTLNMNNFVVPVVGIVTGIVFLDEHLTVSAVVGTLAVLVGMFVTRLHPAKLLTSLIAPITSQPTSQPREDNR